MWRGGVQAVELEPLRPARLDGGDVGEGGAGRRGHRHQRPGGCRAPRAAPLAVRVGEGLVGPRRDADRGPHLAAEQGGGQPHRRDPAQHPRPQPPAPPRPGRLREGDLGLRAARVVVDDGRRQEPPRLLLQRGDVEQGGIVGRVPGPPAQPGRAGGPRPLTGHCGGTFTRRHRLAPYGHAHSRGGRPAPGHLAQPRPPAAARPQAHGRPRQRQRQDPRRLRAGRHHPQAPARAADRPVGRRFQRRRRPSTGCSGTTTRCPARPCRRCATTGTPRSPAGPRPRRSSRIGDGAPDLSRPAWPAASS